MASTAQKIALRPPILLNMELGYDVSLSRCGRMHARITVDDTSSTGQEDAQAAAPSDDGTPASLPFNQCDAKEWNAG